MLNKIVRLLLGFVALRIAEWIVVALAFLLSVYFPLDPSLGPPAIEDDIPTALGLALIFILGYGYIFLSAASYAAGSWIGVYKSKDGLAALNSGVFALFACWFILTKLPPGVFAPWFAAAAVMLFNWFSGRVVADWIVQPPVRSITD